MRLRQRLSEILLAAVLIPLGLAPCLQASPPDERPEPYAVPALSPEEALETIRVPEGYRLEIVAAEPIVHEPVLCVWDGNGRLYVAEMSTYMQDIDGQNQHAPTSQVVRLEDTDGDGRMDRRIVFADGLVLPRMVLPLRDEVIIRETDTLDLWLYRDLDGDGTSDHRELWHRGGPRGGNLEHQPSGLIWNIDNWIYTTYSAHRYRFTRGRVERESLPFGSGQWGLAHDDVGRLYYSTAGGEQPAMDFQLPPVYGQIRLPGELAPGFREVFPIDDVPDVQGGPGRVRPDGSLNHFTGCAGQSIFRGDRLPADLRGDLIIPEPVGRLIRRARPRRVNGKTVLKNVYDRTEFIASTDPNFRPLNSATGPDGCLYIVDMYRGIIQEGNWVRPGSYLRKVVQAYQLDRNIGRGRIYRLVHRDHEPGPRPRLLDASPAELVEALSHPNGWWRDEAQKLLILRGERDVIPALETLARKGAEALGRLHALWTLEGLDAATPELLLGVIREETDPRVRSAAIRISEPHLEKRRPALLEAVRKALEASEVDTVIQAYLSLEQVDAPEFESLARKALERQPSDSALHQIAAVRVREKERLLAEKKRREELRRANERLAKSVESGRVTYQTLCITCHGPQGQGAPSPEDPARKLAPPLAGSPRVLGTKRRLIRILLHGLTGPVDGQSYTELMVPMGSNSDAWIASVLNYIRHSWGHRAGEIEPTDVAIVRENTRDRRRPWTLAELHRFDPRLGGRETWKATASHNPGGAHRAFNGNRGDRWDTGTPQVPGMWFRLELPAITRVQGLVLDAAGSSRDMPVGYRVRVSRDGEQWSPVVREGSGGDSPRTEIDFPSVEARFIEITQTGTKPGLFWSIHDLEVLAAPPPAEPREVTEATEELPPPEKLVEMRGDARRGHRLYERHCRLCHRIGETGLDFGPALDDVGLRLDRRALIEAILEPGAKITEGYRGVTILTTRGQFASGFVEKESGESLVLLQPGGTRLTLKPSEILQRNERAETFMPEDLEKAMTPGEFVDLLEYLAARRDASASGKKQEGTGKGPAEKTEKTGP